MVLQRELLQLHITIEGVFGKICNVTVNKKLFEIQSRSAYLFLHDENYSLGSKLMRKIPTTPIKLDHCTWVVK